MLKNQVYQKYCSYATKALNRPHVLLCSYFSLLSYLSNNRVINAGGKEEILTRRLRIPILQLSERKDPLSEESGMRASTRARYSLRAMLYLAEQDPARAVSVREIAENENISADYLEHLLHTLKGAGLVDSVRGAAGGFKLTKNAKEISIKDIFMALNEKIVPVWCLEVGEACPRAEKCKSRPTWNKLRDMVEDFLGETTLSDAVGNSS